MVQITRFALPAMLLIASASAGSPSEDQTRFLRAVRSRGDQRQLGSYCYLPWKCTGKCKWNWARCDCQCNNGWEGRCCDVTTTCCASSDHVCSWERLVPHTAKVEEVAKGFPLSKEWDDLPAQMKGIFWLKDQEDSSSIMSFGKTNDGGGISTGTYNNGGDYQYSVRVGGDRSWAFADRSTSWKFVEFLDLVYNFQCDGEPNDPVSCDIHGESRNIGLVLQQEFLLNFKMILLDDSEKPEKLKGKAVVWGRPSSLFGIDIKNSYYELTQIIDANGEKTPAFEDYVAYTKSSATGSTPGVIHYRKAN